MCVSRVEIFNNVINEKCTRFTDSLLFATTVAKMMQFSGGALFCHVYYFHLPWSFFTFFLYYLTPLQDTARWVSHKFVVAIN